MFDPKHSTWGMCHPIWLLTLFTCSWRATSIIWLRSAFGLASMSRSECSWAASQLLRRERSPSNCSQWLTNWVSELERCSAHWHTWLQRSPSADSWSSIWKESAEQKQLDVAWKRKTTPAEEMNDLLSPADSSTMTTILDRALTCSCWLSRSRCNDWWSSSIRFAEDKSVGWVVAPSWDIRSSVAVNHTRNRSSWSSCNPLNSSWILLTKK